MSKSGQKSLNGAEGKHRLLEAYVGHDLGWVTSRPPVHGRSPRPSPTFPHRQNPWTWGHPSARD